MDSLAIALIVGGIIVLLVAIRWWPPGKQEAIVPASLVPKLTVEVGADTKAPSSERNENETPPPRTPTFQIVALGLEGAGKTVLLTSMFHKLSSPSPPGGRGAELRAEHAPQRRGELAPDRRYILATDFDSDAWLAQAHAKVRNPHELFPDPTSPGRPQEFLFDCRIRDESNDPRTVLRINYVDYAGDVLESEEHLESRPGLRARVEHADALLVMIDGFRVRQLLKREEAGSDYFNRRIGPILRLAMDAACPVQLILTKWDLVYDTDSRLDEEERCSSSSTG